jgi:hypothetical protein
MRFPGAFPHALEENVKKTMLSGKYLIRLTAMLTFVSVALKRNLLRGKKQTYPDTSALTL